MGAIHKTGFASGADFSINVGLNIFLFLEFFWRAFPVRVDDGAPRAGVKTDATFLTEVGFDVEANLEFPFDRAFRALLGAGAAPNTVLTDAIRHG